VIPVTLEIEGAYAYLPGDVNMALGIWPPTVIGGDVTYLVGYFIGGGQASCNLDGFWASADINGDCTICLLYTSPSPRDRTRSRMPSSA